MKTFSRCGLGLALLLTALAAPSAEASHPKMTMKKMLEQADVGFHGQVISIENEAVPEKGMAFTHVTFRVVDVLFNRAPEQPVGGTIQLTFAGGTVNGKIVKVSDVPEFQVDQEVVALVKHDGNRYANPIIGGVQGLYRVVRDELTQDAYPVTAGLNGIEQISRGELVTTAKVATVHAGEAVYSTEKPRQDAPRVQAPLPATPNATSGEFSISVGKPAHLLRLPEFLGAITEQYQQLASQRR
jgi:hypothetical protein